uniref:Integrase catalytic domain-containing protein n=1 Tax=Tanacetum cinerariifolium TaxID=118510 RepID=A0A6L2NIR6_TANCI|nr:hypothetical protein [Tanacetum cinerariifolium]
MAFLSSPGSTNEVDIASIQVCIVSTPVSANSSNDNTTNLRDATVYAFLANQTNGSQLVHEDLEQIHEDDLEEIDLKWQLALLSMRARRYFQRTGKKITINGSDTTGYDKIKESRPRNQDNSRKTVNVKDTSFKAMVAIDGAGFDWSYMADDEVPTNMALIDFLNLEGAPQDALKDQGYFDSGCSRHMKGNISYLTDLRSMIEGMLPLGEELKVMCDKKNSVLFTDTECFVLSTDFKLADESQVLLKIPRKNNMYSFDMKNIVPQKDLTCLLVKATNEESMLWHRRLGHINFKNINKLVKDNLVIGLPSKCFENDQTYVACLKGKQHKVSFNSKLKNSIFQPLFMLLIDLFGPTSMSSIMHKKYCLVITNDFSKFTWVFFLATKDETSRILNCFIAETENLVEKKVNIIRCDNGTKFSYRVINELCKEKGIKREHSVGKAVNTACYVQNRVLVVKPHFKTPYELFKGRSHALSFLRPFGCHVTILNTLDQLGKFDGKSDEGIFVVYFTTSKAFRVYNIRTRKVEENLHITFLENKPMIAGGGPEWLFDIDALSKLMNYAPVPTDTNSNDFAGKGASFDVGQSSMETRPSQNYILMPLWKDNSLFDSSLQASDGHNKNKHGPYQASEMNTATPTYASYPNDPFMPDLEDAKIFDDDRDEGTDADYNNLETVISVSLIFSTRIHKDHPKEQIIGEVNSAVQTRKMAKQNEVEAMHEELLQFKLLNVWTLVDLPHGKRAIRTKWVYKNKRDQRGIVVRNKARLVAPSHRQEEGIDYDEVFAPVARIKAIRLFMAYALFMDFTVYLMDVKSAFLYGTIEEEIKDDILLVQVYVDDIMFGSTKRSLSTEFEQLMHKRFQMSSMGELSFFLGLVKSASTPMETHKTLSKDAAGTDVDVYLYKSMTSSFMYLTSSRLDIMFAILARKFTTGGCQFLGNRLISWQCKKQTIMANSTTEAEYIAASNCYGQTREELAIPRQTANGKELSNPLMAGILTTARRKLMLLRINLQLLVIVTAVETTVKIKTINDDVRLQALIDGKKVVITEASIRHDLNLNDAEGTSCLPNAVIFEELARMGAKTTSWNEFSSTMESAIIYLANNQKFNFSKYILDNLKKNLEAGVPFYMFPRFIQVFVNHQIGDMSHPKDIYINPSLTKKVFANMKRVGKGFSGAVTPLFDIMMVQAVEEVGDLPTAVQDTPIPDAPSSSQPRRKHKPRRKERRKLSEEEGEQW